MDKEKNREKWENVEELIGKTKKLKVKILANSNGISGIRLMGDKKTVDYKIVFPAESITELTAFNLVFQLPRNRKSRFPYHLPAFEINLDAFEYASINEDNNQ